MIGDNGQVLHFTYRPPSTYLNPNRTAVRVAHGFGGDHAVGSPGVAETMAAASRVQAHRTALEEVLPRQQEKVHHINLPFEVDRNFCRRDDWGRENRAHGLSIGLYRHDDANMRHNQQYVYILHVELSARERPMFNPASPGGFHAFADHA